MKKIVPSLWFGDNNCEGGLVARLVRQALHYPLALDMAEL